MKIKSIMGIVRFTARWIAGISLLYTCSTSPLSEGGGSRGGNPVIVGMIADTSDSKASVISVSLIPENYNPFNDSLKPVITVSTDSLGRFSITAPDSGTYNIQAYKISNGKRLVHYNIKAVLDSTCVVPTDTVRKPGTIRIALPEDIDLNNDFVYVPGTLIAKRVAEAGDTLMIDSVPPGVFPALCFGRRNSTYSSIIRHDVSVHPNQITTIRYPKWSYCQKITLNTTSSGADIKENVYGFPILVRLSENNFDFSTAQSGGEDIRFTNTRGNLLPYEIEQWEPSIQRASIWVKIDTVYGNNNTQSILMYWGNAITGDNSKSTEVFDTAAGFQGVWHLNQENGNQIKDATVNGYNGSSQDTSLPKNVNGIIGLCRSFDGIDDFISMPNTAKSSLNFPENGYFTISAWVNLDTLDSTPHLIAAKGYDQYFLRLTYFPAGTPVWEFSKFNSNSTWQTCTTSAQANQWALITGVQMGSKQILYINGSVADSIPNTYQAPGLTRNTSDDFSIGKFQHIISLPNDTEGYCFFRGDIDEVRIDGKARSADWVKLCYMNQRTDDRLVVFNIQDLE